jgi:hypothetical protein
MVTPALVTAILAAFLVQLRHRELVVAVQHDPSCEPMRRRQLIFETWVLTGPSLALLLAGSAFS